MPNTSGINASSKGSLTRVIKRCVIAAAIAIAALFALDQLGLSSGTLAQRSGKIVRRVDRNQSAGSDCSFLKAPENFRGIQARHREAISRMTEELRGNSSDPNSSDKGLSLIQASEAPRKNVIDDILFTKMESDGIAAAPLCTDEEFLRRVSLDLTGRIPSPDEVTSFVQDVSANKRDALVDRLISSPEYIDKWTMFFGDLFKNTLASSNITLYFGGREAFYNFIKESITENRGYDQVARAMIANDGDSYVNGEVNFTVLCNVTMGPAQDTYDGQAVNVATTFLGLSSMDCLLCHNGAGHLNQINLWGTNVTRADAWGMSAFFARTNRQAVRYDANSQKYNISERPNGEYQLNTNSGNRQPRTPINGKNTVDPKYLFGGGGVNSGENRRQAIARLVTEDLQFSRATVNYVWEKMMVEALVSPSNTFDPARLDPKAQLPGGWSLQPANPALLESLASEFKNSGYDLRFLIGLIAKSSVYQLSSKYPGEWKLEYVPYYARKYARRLDAEEVHDAIIKATGQPVLSQYRDGNNQAVTITGYPIMNQANQFVRSVEWAMQLPDTTGGNGGFMNAFLRGNRDTSKRSGDASILQALTLMNNAFVTNRVHQGNRVIPPGQPEIPSTVRKLLADTSLSNEQIITQLYLYSLSRYPTAAEKTKLLAYYVTLGKTQATENIQWTLLNKADFIFNY